MSDWLKLIEIMKLLPSMVYSDLYYFDKSLVIFYFAIATGKPDHWNIYLYSEFILPNWTLSGNIFVSKNANQAVMI